jgi:uncharacterized protein involved in exopolysaccharide biosynthesis
MIAVGLRERLSPMEKTVAGVKMGLQVKNIEGSNTLSVELYLPARVGAGSVLNALLDEYLKYRLSVFRDRGDELFKQDMEERSKALSNASVELNRFESRARISDQPQQKQVLLKQLAEVEHETNAARIDLEEAKARVHRFDSESAKSKPNYGALGGFESSTFQRNLLTDMAAIEKRHQEFLLTEMEGSERISNLLNQLRALAGILSANLRAVLMDKQARSDALHAEQVRLQKEIGGLHGAETDWTELRRKAFKLEEEYSFYRRKYEESSAARRALENRMSESISIVQHAQDPIQAAGVSKTTILGIGLLAGILAALSLVAVGEFFDDRFYSASQLERSLGIPVVAIPHLKQVRTGIQKGFGAQGAIR